MTHKDKITREATDNIMQNFVFPHVDEENFDEKDLRSMWRAMKKMVNTVYDEGYNKSQGEFKQKRDKFFYKYGI